MNIRVNFLFGLLVTLFILGLSVAPAQAKYIGGEPPKPCACQACNAKESCVGETCSICRSQGNITEHYPVVSLRSATGPTVNFSLYYNSYNADNSHAQLDLGLGYGWTHSYNILLFSQRGYMFRSGSDGLVTRYQPRAGGSFIPTNGYFETLQRNADGSFTLTQKDKTIYQFAQTPGDTLLINGPVWRLMSIKDRNGNTTTLTYSGGRLTTIRDTYGRHLTLTYNTQGHLESITDPLNRATTLHYDGTGRRLITITDPNGKSVRYTYNFLTQLTEKLDKDGRRTTFLYSNGKPTGAVDGDGNNLFGLSNPTNWATNDNTLALNLMREYIPSTTTKIDGRGNVWKYDYDKNGYITKITAPDNAATTFTYDPATLQIAAITDANNHTTRYQYDVQGNLIRQTDAQNHVTAYTYDPVFNQLTRITDANNRVTTYTIDPANGNRLQERDPLGQTLKWTYDSHGNVLTETDKRNNTTTHVYDAFGNRIQTTDRENHVWRMTYDAVGNLITRTDPLLHTTQYEYDPLDRLTEETKPLGDPLQADTQYFYDGQGNRTQVIDRNGNATSYQYDVRQRLTVVTDAQPKSVLYSYDGNNNRTSVTDKNDHTTKFDYDVQNRLVKTTDAENNVSTMTYDPVGNKLSETDANIHTTLYTYDELNRLKTRTDAEGFVTTMAYDMIGTAICGGCTGPIRGSGLVTQQIDGNGKVTYFTYDALDRLVKQIRKQGDTAFTIDADDAVTTYTYDPNNNRLTITEPNNNTTSYEYDKLDRQTKMTNAAGDITRTSYDPDGNVKTVTAPNGNVTTNTYDSLERLTQVNDSVGRVASYTYDPVGNRLTECDGNNHCTTNAYDTIYRLTAVTDALGKTTRYDYDFVGNLTKTTDREGHVTTYVYDKINRRIQMTDALGNVTDYRYDGVGNLARIQITDAVNHKVQPTDYAYDDINRLAQETYPDGKSRFFAYDAVNLTARKDQKNQVTNYLYSDLYFLLERDYPGADHDDAMTYDLSGRMLSACRGGAPDDLPADSCAGWLVTFAYDGANRVTQTKQNNKTVSYVYDIPGRKRTLTYPGGRVITENTDLRSRLATIDDTASPPIVTYRYDLGNRVVTRDYRNGATASYSYNDNNWITDLEHKRGATRIAGFGYAFDNEGNKQFENKRHDSTRSEGYDYDELYRLIDYKVGALVGSTVPMPTTQTQYELDGLGNWDQKSKDGVTENRAHNLVNELTAIDIVSPLSHEDLSYDDNGNLIEDGRYRYAYDEENRLTKVTRKSDNAVVGQYQYDALSRRIQKIANPAGSSTTTRYFYDDARIIEEQDAGGATLATYVYGNYIDEVLTMTRGGGTFYYHQNSLWSVEAITNAAGNPVERYSYDAYGLPSVFTGAGASVPPNAWGTPHSAIGNPWMFTGRQFDEETGIYFYRARYYDPVKGRFLQRDPLGYVDGMNLYGYLEERPTHFVDPTGMLENPQCCSRKPVCGEYPYCNVGRKCGIFGLGRCTADDNLKLCRCGLGRIPRPNWVALIDQPSWLPFPFLQRDSLGYVDGMSLYGYLENLRSIVSISSQQGQLNAFGGGNALVSFSDVGTSELSETRTEFCGFQCDLMHASVCGSAKANNCNFQTYVYSCCWINADAAKKDAISQGHADCQRDGCRLKPNQTVTCNKFKNLGWECKGNLQCQ